MKNLLLYVLIGTLGIVIIQACGPSEEELREQELARQDSLQQVYAQQMEQMRQDSIAQARRDSIAVAQAEEEEANRIEYSEDGNFTVQIQAWRSESKAEKQADEWRSKGFEHAFVVQFGDESTGDVWYRVRIGRFDTHNMAEKMKTILENEHQAQSWVSRLDAPVQPDAMMSE